MKKMYARGVLVLMVLLGGCSKPTPHELIEVSSLDRLASSLDPYEWVQLSRALRDEEVDVGREFPGAYVKYTLSGMTGATAAERDSMLSSVVELGDLAVGCLCIRQPLCFTVRRERCNNGIIRYRFFGGVLGHLAC